MRPGRGGGQTRTGQPSGRSSSRPGAAAKTRRGACAARQAVRVTRSGRDSAGRAVTRRRSPGPVARLACRCGDSDGPGSSRRAQPATRRSSLPGSDGPRVAAEPAPPPNLLRRRRPNLLRRHRRRIHCSGPVERGGGLPWPRGSGKAPAGPGRLGLGSSGASRLGGSELRARIHLNGWHV